MTLSHLHLPVVQTIWMRQDGSEVMARESAKEGVSEHHYL